MPDTPLTSAACGYCGNSTCPCTGCDGKQPCHVCDTNTRVVHRNWQVALDALVEDAPACGLDPFKIRKRAERAVSHYKSDRTRYDVIRHMHDAMLAEANR